MASAGKYTLLAVQLVGAAIAICLVAVTFLSPDEVESRLQSFAIAKVEEAANTAWDEIEGQFGEGGRAERLGALADRLGLNADALLAERDVIVPALIAYALSDRCTENCSTAVIAGVVVDTALVQRAAQFRLGQTTVEDFLVERYETSVAGLIADLRRFGVVNAIVLLLLAGLTALRNVLNWRFAAFSVALTGYTAWAAHGYVYKQDWALAILLQDWAAPGYQTAMIFVALFLADWLFLNGFFSKLIGNALATIAPG